MNIPFKTGQPVYTVDEKEHYHYEKEDLGHDHLGPIGYRDVKVTDGYEFFIKKEPFYFGLLDKYDVSEIFTTEARTKEHLDKLTKEKKNKSYNNILETHPRCAGEILPMKDGGLQFSWSSLPGNIRLCSVLHENASIEAWFILPLKPPHNTPTKLTLSKAEKTYLRKEMERHCFKRMGLSLDELLNKKNAPLGQLFQYF